MNTQYFDTILDPVNYSLPMSMSTLRAILRVMRPIENYRFIWVDDNVAPPTDEDWQLGVAWFQPNLGLVSMWDRSINNWKPLTFQANLLDNSVNPSKINTDAAFDKGVLSYLNGFLGFNTLPNLLSTADIAPSKIKAAVDTSGYVLACDTSGTVDWIKQADFATYVKTQIGTSVGQRLLKASFLDWNNVQFGTASWNAVDGIFDVSIYRSDGQQDKFVSGVDSGHQTAVPVILVQISVNAASPTTAKMRINPAAGSPTTYLMYDTAWRAITTGQFVQGNTYLMFCVAGAFYVYTAGAYEKTIQLAIPAGDNSTQTAHGMTGTPRIIASSLACTNLGGSDGFPAGTEFQLLSLEGSRGYNAFSVRVDGDNVYVSRFLNGSANQISLVNATTNTAILPATYANWAVKVTLRDTV